MHKIIGRLFLVGLFLTLMSGLVMADPPSNSNGKEVTSIDSLIGNGEQKKDINQDRGDVKPSEGSDDRLNGENNGETGNLTAVIKDNGDDIGEKKGDLPQPNPSPNPTPPPDPWDTFHTVLLMIGAVLGIINIIGLIVLGFASNRKSGMPNISDAVSTKDLEKINQEIDKLSKTVEKLKPKMGDTESSIEEQMSYHTERTNPSPAEERNTKSFGHAYADGEIRGTVTPNSTISGSSGYSSHNVGRNHSTMTEVQQLALDFNAMMDSLATASGLGIRSIKDKFMRDHRAIAFKCVNFEERVNRPGIPPQFAQCMPSESTLWGVPLSNDRMAVLPSLPAYEMTAHLQGGLKELFESGYRVGSYRNIKVVEPAIVSRDFKVIKKGVLKLS